jgi:DNA-binding IclR family transcriptional regulator
VRKTYNEELNDLYFLRNIVQVIKSRRMRKAGHVARVGARRGVHRILVEKPEGTRPLERPRRGWKDNMYL